MITYVISGGQTGADQAGLRAARRCGITTGGWAPKHWLVEAPDGLSYIPDPTLRDFGLKEHPMAGFPARTESNAWDADGTVWFGRDDTSGFKCTNRACLSARMPLWKAQDYSPEALADILRRGHVHVLNVAGQRESRAPGIGARTEAYLVTLFHILTATNKMSRDEKFVQMERLAKEASDREVERFNRAIKRDTHDRPPPELDP